MSAALLIAAVRSEFQRYGYVRWADVADNLGVSRQSVHKEIQRAVENGKVDTTEYETWRKSYLNAGVRKLRLTPDNWEWLEAEAQNRGRRRDDVLNELLNVQRLLSTHSPNDDLSQSQQVV